MKKLFTLFIAAVFCLCAYGQTAEEPSGGIGRIPYYIEKWENLVWLSQNSDKWDQSFEQTADIVFPAGEIENWDNDQGFLPVGNSTTPFSGSYDGKGFSISNVFIDRSANYVGLFGKTDGAVLRNLNVSGSVTGSGYYAGMLCGYISGTSVEKSSTRGSVENKGQNGVCGGFVGASAGLSSFENCFSRCAVTLEDYQEGNAGGFVGYTSESAMLFSYCTGAVTDGVYCGGFIGLGENSIGQFSRNFYNSESSGHNDNYGATPLTSSEMFDSDSYAGWDFQNVWFMDSQSNNGYPNFKALATAFIEPGIEKNVVYPNPFDEIIYVNSDAEISHVVISDLSGQRVCEFSGVGLHQIETAHVSPGMYLVEIVYSDGFSHCCKMIKR